MEIVASSARPMDELHAGLGQVGEELSLLQDRILADL
jgi:hypothetical protein